MKHDLKTILDKHSKWVNDEEGGERANLRGADLRRANLRCANLRCANLRCANLEGVNLSGANLEDANLEDANLRGANLRGADLEYANLIDADLRRADLRRANLRCANLRRANLEGVFLMNVIGNNEEIISGQTSKYNFAFTSEILQIGCENHPIQQWWDFDEETISAMDDGALEWWGIWKPLLIQIIKVSLTTRT